ncbi:MAG: hypothetical protein ABI670_10480 [Chloroflexota bacterium]
MSNSEEPISVVEDLDPEPQGKRGAGWQSRELVFGLLLLFGVLGFAGWQWIKQDNQQSSYARGTNALARQDWEAAVSLFSGASGYRDADKQAMEAASKISERNRQYEIAIGYAQAGNWAAALKSIQIIEEIQSGYKDTERLEEQAKRQVYGEAMSGTIALRPNANPPGLYYYGANGWVWLPKSDAYSRLWSNSVSSRLTYDVPGPGWTPKASAPQPGERTDSTQLAGRFIMLTDLPDFTNTTALSLDLSTYNSYPWLWSNSGVWERNLVGSVPGKVSPIHVQYADLREGPVMFQPFSSPRTTTIAPPVISSTAIVDLDPISNRYLLADWSGTTPDGSVTSDTVTNLYAAGIGAETRLIYTLKGGSFISAQISPDGRYALVNTYTPTNIQTEQQEMLLLDLQGKAAPRTLDSVVAMTSPNFPQYKGWMSAVFIGDGPFKGKILLAEYSVNRYRLRVVDRVTEGKPFVDIIVPTADMIAWSIYPGNNNQMLVAGVEQSTIWPLPTRPLRFIVISADGSAKLTRLTIEEGNSLDNAMLTGDRLVYSTIANGSAKERTTRSVYSFPIRRFGIDGERPWTMYKQTGTANGVDISNYGSHSFGPDLFAYITGSDLHARVYDGSVDVVLEHHITYLYRREQPAQVQGWLR